MTAQPAFDFDPIDARNPLYFPSRAERAAIHAISLPSTACNAGLPNLDGGDGAGFLLPANLLPPSAGVYLRPALAEGGSFFDLFQCRARQLADGHTPAADAANGIYPMLRLLVMRLRDAESAWHINPNRRDPAALRHHLVHLAATALALVDVLDRSDAQ